MTDGNLERPRETTQTDVTLVTRGITIQATVELSNALALVVRPLAETYARGVGVKPGDRVELYWRGDFEERMLPADISAVEDGDSLLWNLTVTGPAERSTRRKAVRARVEVPVRLRVLGNEVTGETIDLSEAGMRAAVDGWGLPPQPGTVAGVEVEMDADVVRVRGVVVRLEERAGRWVMSLRFEGVSEKDEDRLRRRVFQALREERARLNED